jgi:hypothetical protein
MPENIAKNTDFCPQPRKRASLFLARLPLNLNTSAASFLTILIGLKVNTVHNTADVISNKTPSQKLSEALISNFRSALGHHERALDTQMSSHCNTSRSLPLNRKFSSQVLHILHNSVITVG